MEQGQRIGSLVLVRQTRTGGWVTQCDCGEEWKTSEPAIDRQVAKYGVAMCLACRQMLNGLRIIKKLEVKAVVSGKREEDRQDCMHYETCMNKACRTYSRRVCTAGCDRYEARHAEVVETRRSAWEHSFTYARW